MTPEQERLLPGVTTPDELRQHVTDQIYMAVRDGMNVHEAVGAAAKAVADYRAWASKQRLGG